jgi:AcrR family transcriptional regulator
MTVSQRREQAKIDMRQLIVDAAIKMYIQEGYEKLTLRGIAQGTDYSTTTIYLYFKDKHELYHAMHEWAFKQLLMEFDTLSGIKNPVERLKGISAVFIEFAFKNPELYDLMFILREPMCAEANFEDWKCGQAAYQFLVDTLSECLEQNLIVSDNVQALAFMFWSSTHGMISLYLRNRLRMYDGMDLKQFIFYVEEMILKQFISAWRFKP